MGFWTTFYEGLTAEFPENSSPSTLKRFFSFGIFFFLLGILTAHSQTSYYSSSNENPQSWIFEEATEEVEGLGVAAFSRFNPEKSWKKALENAVTDLNANHSLIVSHYGYQIGQGPLRLRSDYAIRTFWDTTQVTVIDSARWQGQAFIRVKPPEPLPDSLLYPNMNLEYLTDSLASQNNSYQGRWLLSTGSTPKIDSNWNKSVTKAKQEALRKLAEDLSVKISTEIYSTGETSRRYYNFSTLFAFQRIRVLKRSFQSDSVKVQVAVNPKEVKMLMD